MKHIQVAIKVTGEQEREELIAQLEAAGFEGFEETAEELLAYIAEEKYPEADVKEIAGRYKASFSTNTIEEQNWNATWEENFQPVIVPGICTVRAHFHDIVADTPYEIIITPKMSFGTGHHATTMLMMMQMEEIDMKGKRVLDFGTGTGILAILAEQMGAGGVDAIDNDEWSYENALENVERNDCKHIKVRLGSLELGSSGKYDVILANINRHILLHYMKGLYERLNPGGTLLMSGLLRDDQEIIEDAAKDAGFKPRSMGTKDNWIVLRMLDK